MAAATGQMIRTDTKVAAAAVTAVIVAILSIIPEKILPDSSPIM
jgi:hypothetical protein